MRAANQQEQKESEILKDIMMKMQKSLKNLACRNNADSGTDKNPSPLAFKLTGQRSGSS